MLITATKDVCKLQYHPQEQTHTNKCTRACTLPASNSEKLLMTVKLCKVQGGPKKWYLSYITLHCTRRITFLAHPVYTAATHGIPSCGQSTYRCH